MDGRTKGGRGSSDSGGSEPQVTCVIGTGEAQRYSERTASMLRKATSADFCATQNPLDQN